MAKSCILYNKDRLQFLCQNKLLNKIIMKFSIKKISSPNEDEDLRLLTL